MFKYLSYINVLLKLYGLLSRHVNYKRMKRLVASQRRICYNVLTI
jgi:hypothetical protein